MLSFKWCRLLRLLPSCCVRLPSRLRRSKALGSGCNDKSAAFLVVTSHKSGGCGRVRAVRNALVSALPPPAPLRMGDKEKEGSRRSSGAGTELRGDGAFLERKGASLAKVLLIKCQFHCGAV